MRFLVALIALAMPLSAAAPCCGITAIGRDGVITARENATGQVFQFSAPSGVASRLKVGQGVYANFATRQVSVDGEAPCCNITNVAPAAPCCSVVKIDAGTGLATAREAATGKTFQFKVQGAAASLKPGDSVFADFAKAQVSVDGVVPCCSIAPQNATGTAAAPVVPCCSVVSTDARTGLATARDKATGNTFQFKVQGAAAKLKPGYSVFADFAKAQVSVDGITPCCTIAPQSATGAAAAPVAPCCNVVSIDARTGLATARDKATGKTFQFKTQGAASKLKVGDGVYANLAAGTVSVDGLAPCCNITH